MSKENLTVQGRCKRLRWVAGHRVGGERTKNRDKIILKMFGGKEGEDTKSR